MLSRLASRAVLQAPSMVSRPIVVGIQKASSAPALEEKSGPLNAHIEDPINSVPRIMAKRTEGPERDLVNFPRPVQKEHPDPVRLAFIPEEYFDFFYKKTGVSGPYMFGFGVMTWMLSKEIYVLEHNFYNGISLLIIIAIIHNKFGPVIAAKMDKEIEKWQQQNDASESFEKDSMKEEIESLTKFNEDIEVYKDIVEANRETAAAALEVTYREWQHSAYKEVKKRLDYQLELVNAERRIAQKNMTSWIINSVLKSLTPAQEAEALKKCISDLKSLSASV